MGTDKKQQSHSKELPQSVTKSVHDAGHAVETTPAVRRNDADGFAASVHDVTLSVETSPASRVAAAESTTSQTATAAMAALPVVKTSEKSPTGE
jgi:hypothetical protein